MSSSLLRFCTCGSVDDGKSTLIGRLLFETKQVFADQLDALGKDSVRFGTQNGDRDFALLLDGLQAEREQGITIDVGYRFFASGMRRFIVADTPGHVQYTRNTATGASTADLAVVLVDVRKGITQQTYRHTRIVSLLGVPRIVLAVNKMDLVDWSEAAFSAIATPYHDFVAGLGSVSSIEIPMSALHGDNVVRRSAQAPWFEGPPLNEYLEQVDIDSHDPGPFCMPVQYVNRPNAGFRGYCGRVTRGVVRGGQRVRVFPSGRRSAVNEVIVSGGPIESAAAGESITLTLADDIDVSRGDVIADETEPIVVTKRFTATVVCLSDDGLAAARPYLLKAYTRQVAATVDTIQHRVDVASGAELPATRLEANDIGSIEVSTETSLAVAPYIASRALGAFILIDRITNATVGAGMITHVSADGASTRRRPRSVGAEQRAALKHQRPCCIWLTASAGLDTRAIGELLERRLYADGCHTYRIDAHDDRAGPIGEIVRMMVDAGLILIVSAAAGAVMEQLRLSAPLRADEFIEVRFGDGHVEGGAGAAREDARSSAPTRPIVVATARRSSEECIDELVRQLVDRAMLLEHIGR